MRIFFIIWLIIAAILLVTGLFMSLTKDKKSKKAKTGFLLSSIGCLMSAVYFFGSLFF